MNQISTHVGFSVNNMNSVVLNQPNCNRRLFTGIQSFFKVTLGVSIVLMALVGVNPLRAQVMNDQAAMEARVKQTLKKNGESIRFKENKGQLENSKVLYYFESAQSAVYIESDRIRFVAFDYARIPEPEEAGIKPLIQSTEGEKVRTLKGTHTFSIYMDGAAAQPKIRLGDAFGTKYNQFFGDDQSKWTSGIRASKDLTLEDVYPGIDLRLYSTPEGLLEFDWILDAGADFNKVKMRFAGQDQLDIDKDGNLKVDLRFTNLKFGLPESYQVTDMGKTPVDFKFTKLENNTVAFTTDKPIDSRFPLVIDPVLNWGTFMDGNDAGFDQYLFAIQIDDAEGMMYCAGATNINIPTSAAPYDADGFLNSIGGFTGAGPLPRVPVVYRLTIDGSNLVDLTMLGPADVTNAQGAVAYGLSLSPTRVFICGRTVDITLPTAGTPFDGVRSSGDGFVAVFSRDLGTYVYGTFLGGSGQDIPGATSIRAIDDNTFVVGMTVSGAALPASYISGSAADATFSGVGSEMYIAKFSSLNTLTWGTYVGSDGGSEVFEDIEVFADGRVAFCGYGNGTMPEVNPASGTQSAALDNDDGIIGVLNSTGTAFNYLDELGGSGNLFHDRINDVTIVGSVLYWTGVSALGGFPVTGGVYDNSYNTGLDAVVGKVNASGGAPGYAATYYGSASDDLGNGIKLVSRTSCDGELEEFLLVFGSTRGNVPAININGDAFYDDSNNGNLDMFFAAFKADLTGPLQFGTLMGGPQDDYLGDTGDPRGANHLWVSGASVYVGTTTHNASHSPVLVGNGGFDPIKSNTIDPPQDDAHLIFGIAFNALLEADYSDAPTSYGAPLHILNCTNLFIGAELDAEPAPFPGALADGDDANLLPDDEDGVASLPVLSNGGPQTINITVNNVTNTTGFAATLYAWIDLDGDGKFEAGEVASVPVADPFTGPKTLTWPNVIVSGLTNSHYLRLRLTTDMLTDNAGTPLVDERSTVGAADGEVEDYLMEALCNIMCNVLGPTSVCANSTENIYFTPNEYSTYLWSITSGNGVIAGSTTNPTVSVNAPALPGTYTVTVMVTDANGCTATCSSIVTVLPNPTCVIGGPATVCPDALTQHCAQAGYDTYQWSISGGGGAIIGSATGNCVNVDASSVCNTSYTLNLTITEDGCESSCSFVVSVQDIVPPVIVNCPAPLVLQCGNINNPTLISNWLGGVTATDNCGPVTVINNFNPNGFSDLCGATGAQLVTFSTTDICNNPNLVPCQQTITIIDNTIPVITCPAPITGLTCVSVVPPAHTTIAQFTGAGGTAVDNCSPTANLTVTSTDDRTFAQLNLCSANIADRTIIRTYTVRDECNNPSICTQNIVFDQDVTPPVIACPAQITGLTCASLLPAAHTTIAQFTGAGGTAVDNCTPTANLTVSSTDDRTFAQLNLCSANVADRTIVRTYTIRDACNNPSTCTQNIVFDQDLTPPVIACPAAITGLTCLNGVPPANTTIGQFIGAGGTATDNCTATANLTVSSSDDKTLAQLNLCSAVIADRTIVRTYTVLDACLNPSTCTQNIVFDQDVTPPVITCPAAITGLTCTSGVPLAHTTIVQFTGAGGTATDICTPTANLTVTSSDDKTLAQLNLCSPILADRTIVRTYTIRDGCNNPSTCTQNIVFEDITPPVITCPGPITGLTCVSVVPAPHTTIAQFTGAGGTATDLCTPTANLTVTSSDDKTFAQLNLCSPTLSDRTIVRTYTVLDACLNPSTCTQNIVFDQDVTPPMVTCPAAITGLTCSNGLPVAFTTIAQFTGAGGTATDICTPTANLTVTSVDDKTLNDLNICSPLAIDRTIVRTYTIRDACNNPATCTQNIVFDQDVTPPTITCPMNVTVNCGQPTNPAVTGMATATDACGTPIVTFTDAPGGPVVCPTISIINRTWNVADNCGGTTCLQQISIQDVTAPVLNCPADLLLNCANIANPGALVASINAWIATASALDACQGAVAVTSNYNGITIPDFSCDLMAGQGLAITFTTTDACNNATNCIRYVYLYDSAPPTSIDEPADITVTCVDEIPLPAWPTATDVCDQDVQVDFLGETTSNNGFTIIRTWKATDDCGNTYMDTQMITIIPINTCTAELKTCPTVYGGMMAQFTLTDANLLVTCGLAGFTVTYHDSYSNAQQGLLPLASPYTSPTANVWARIVAADGCVAIDIVELVVLTSPSLTLAATTVSCNGGNNGSVTASSNVGPAPYTFVWSNMTSQGPQASNNSTITGLVAGTYTVTLTDGNGCTAVESILVTQPNELNVTIGSISDVSCFDGNNGSATATATGGTASYNFLWSNGTANATVNNLVAGIHMVTVIDANGCMDVANVTIAAPLVPLTATVNAVNADCAGGNNGSASVTPSGGTVPYTYLWSNGSTTASASNLAAGGYTVTITDLNGCSIVKAVTILDPTGILLVVTNVTNANCFGSSTGSATVTASGGVGTYMFTWSGGIVNTIGATSTATGLAAGTYTVTVTTNGGACSAVQTVVILQPTQVLAQIIASSNETCPANNDGSATVNATGGTTPYTYLWSSGALTPTATGLAAPGPYTVTVSDINLCTATTSVNISQPALLTATATGVDPNCFNGADGSATVLPVGGTQPYLYLWSNGSTDATATGLSDGTYGVTVTDGNNCTATASVTIDEPSDITLTLSSTAANCAGGDNGTATVVASGGDGPLYTYLWSSGATTATAPGLAAGGYTVTVTDESGCTKVGAVEVSDPTGVLLVVTQVTNETCDEANNGTATVLASGGTSPYTFVWSGGTVVTVSPTSTASNLGAGTYTVTATDAAGCSAVQTVIIHQPTNLLAQIVAQTNVFCFGGSNGTATVNATGGTTNYTYLWTNGQTTATATGLAAGPHSVVVTDASGCTATVSVTITQPLQALSASITSTINVTCNGANNGALTVTAVGGTAPYSYLWSNGSTDKTATSLSAGTIYTVTITDDNNCTTTASGSVTQPSAIAVTMSSVNANCAGGDNGSATAVASGGSGPYDFYWSTGFIQLNQLASSTNTGLAAGGYNVTVVDNNGCSSVGAVEVADPTGVTLVVTNVTNENCDEANNGSASVTASGGTAPYTFVWSGGTVSSVSPNSTASNLSAGTYTVTATDAAGCSVVQTVVIGQPTNLIVTIIASTNETCPANNNGTATALATGGTPGYNYSWSNGDAGITADNLQAGVTYFVTATDVNLCSATASITVNEPVVLTAAASVVRNVSCFGGNNGSATVTHTGGTPTYTYLWSNGSTDKTAMNLSAGIYTVTVFDANNCTATSMVTVMQPAASVFVTMSSVNANCAGGDNGSATAVPNGGVSPYDFFWSTGYTQIDVLSSTASGLAAGGYTVTISDFNGCTTVGAVEVADPTGVTLVVSTVTNETCDESNNGTATVVANGGTSPYDFVWSNGQIFNNVVGPNAASTATNLPAGTHTVTVTDDAGCVAVQTVIITQPTNLLAVIINVENTLCTGSSTGSATVSATGGVTNYTYLWPVNAGSQTTATAINLAAGSYTVTVTDANLCTATATATILSNGALVAANVADITVCPGGNVSGILLSSTPFNPNIVYTWTGGAAAGLVNGNSTGLNPVIPGFTASNTEGTTTVTLTATLSTCSSIQTFDIIILDNTPPSFVNCPNDITVGNDVDKCGANIVYSTPVATDVCDANVVITQTGPPSGSLFPVGTTTIVFTANDGNGNTFTCDFTITVMDMQDPTAVCQDITIYLDANGVASIVPADVNGGSSDNCLGTLTYTLSQSAFDCDDLGDNNVTLTVSDGLNSSICVAEVTVVDDILPVIECPDGIITTTDPEVCGAVVEFAPPVISDNCALLPVADVVNFPFNGGVQQWTVPAGVTEISIEAWGAEGGDGGSQDNPGGLGGYAKGTLAVTPGQILDIYVGGKGGESNASDLTNPGGFNGGGNGGFDNSPQTQNAGGGGGASDVRVSGNRVIVAGGGGGAASGFFNPSNGGNGGGLTGLAGGATFSAIGGGGGTQVSGGLAGNLTRGATNGSLGLGGNGSTNQDAWGSGGGGGGWYGGGGGTSTVNHPSGHSAGGGGGSSYIGGVTGGLTNPGVWMNDGFVFIQYNIAGEGTLEQTAGLPSGSTFPVGTTTNIFVVTDAGGNTASCSFDVTVTDDEDPSITCPQNAVITTETLNTPGDCFGQYLWDHPIPSDNCGIDQFSITYTNPNGTIDGPDDVYQVGSGTISDNANHNFAVGTTTVTYYVEDSNGNTVSCNFTVTVTDTEEPVFVNCPADITVGNDVDVCGANVVYSTPIAVDNCDANVSVTQTGLPSGSVFPIGTTTIVFTANDGNGNTFTCDFTITVTDEQLPDAVCKDITVALDAQGAATITAASVDNSSSDNCTIITLSINDNAFNCDDLGTNIVILTVTDAALNVATCMSVVTVVDEINPTMTCPPSLTAVCAASEQPVYTTLAQFITAGGSAADNCGIESFILENETDNGLTCPRTITRTYRVSDESGNTATCVQTLIVDDNIVPTITAPANLTLSCVGDQQDNAAAIITWLDNYTATDNCAGAITVTHNFSGTTINYCTGANITVTWTATDACGNVSTTASQIVVTPDVTAAVITAPANLTLSCVGDQQDNAAAIITWLDNYTVSDGCDSEVTVTHNFSSTTINYCTGGNIIVTWTATDDCNNASTTSATIVIIPDVTAPVITAPANLTLSCVGDQQDNAAAIITWLDNYTVSDGCDSEVTVTHNFSSTTINYCTGGNIIVTWTATDDCNNASTTSATIVIIPDVTAPVITAPANLTLSCVGDQQDNAAAIITWLDNYTVSDGCDSEVTVTHNFSSTTINYCTGGNIIVTWTATDDCNNASTTSATIVIIPDATAPVITAPANLTLSCVGDQQDNAAAIITWLDNYTVSDGCDSEVTVTHNFSSTTINYCTGGNIIVTWTATDDCNNASTTSATIVIIPDVTAPVIIAPANLTLSCVGDQQDNAAAIITWLDNYTVSDGCDSEVTVTHNFSSTTINYCTGGNIIVTWTATDDCNNASTTSATIVIIPDVTAPVIIAPANLTLSCTPNQQNNTAALIDWLDNYTVSDGCDSEVTVTHNFSPTTTIDYCNGNDITVTWTATDDCNNVSTATSVIVVNPDVTPPVFVNCPTSITLNNDVDECGTNATWSVPVANDFCTVTATVTKINGPDQGTFLPVGNHTVTYLATDGCGNTASCTLLITVLDVQTPTAVCEDITVYLDANGNATIEPADVDGGSTDNCDDDLELEIDEDDFTCDNVGDNNVTLTVTDAAENTSICVATVTVLDTIKPTFTCPADITVSSCYDVVPDVITGIVDEDDNCGVASVTQNPPAGVAFGNINGGSTIITVTVTDENGNVRTCDVDVTITDDTDPVITCPPSVVVGNDVDKCGANVTYSIATATDDCPGVLVELQQGSLPSGAFFPVGETTVVFVATDAGNNVVTCEFTVEVMDMQTPTAVCQDITIYLDANGNATIEPADVDGGSTDNCQDDLLLEIDISSFDCDNVGDNNVTLTVTDGAENTSICVATVTVIDSIKPTFTCPADVTVDGCDDLVPDVITGITDEADNCGVASITQNPVAGLDFGQTNGNSVVITVTVTDVNGNVRTCAVDVIINDDDNPDFLNCPTTMIMIGNDPDQCSGKVNWQPPVAVDDCIPLPISAPGIPLPGTVVQTSGPLPGSVVAITCPPTPTTITYIATDGAGNTSSCTFQVMVVDTEKPEFDADIIMPNDTVVNCHQIPSNCVYHGPNVCTPLTNSDVNDNCTSPQNLVINYTEVSTQCANQALCCFYDYDLTRTWTVTDCAGNQLIHVQEIEVQDTTAPVAICKNITITLDKNGKWIITPADINNGSFDNCAAPQFLTYTISQSTFTCLHLGPNVVTLTVTDPCGNFSTCTAIVTVVEGIAPCVPEYMVQTSCLDNATTLDNGQFQDIITVKSLAMQTWTLTANNGGLFTNTSPAPPAAGVVIPVGAVFTAGTADGIDNDGDGTVDEADEMIFYTLRGRFTECIGYTITISNSTNFGMGTQATTSTISNKACYPTPYFVNLDGPFCISTPPFVIEVGEYNNAAGTVGGFMVNGVNTNIFDAGALGEGFHTVMATFDAGTATQNLVINGVQVGGSMADALADPGCKQKITKVVQVTGTPTTVACNDLINISLDSSCVAVVFPDMVLEGTYYCFDDYTVVLNYPAGTTQFTPPNRVDATHINKTITYTLVHIISGNMCWGTVKVEDKLAPKLTCPPDLTLACSEPTNVAYTGTVGIQDCSATTTQIDEEVIDNGECGDPRQVITRTFIVTDAWSNQSLCTQIITVVPFDLADVIMPSDITINCEVVNANPGATSPNNTGRPSINGAPIGIGGLCSASIGYTDEILTICEGSYEILRTWKVRNTCLPIVNGDNPIEHYQVIRVIDNGGPAFSCPNDITVSVDPFTCCATAALPDVIISEGCSNIYELEAKVTGVDPSSGNITTFTVPGSLADFPGNNYWIPDTLAVFLFTQCLPNDNTYTVRYTAKDECGNISSCEFDLTVADLVPPAVSCDEFTQVSLGIDGRIIVNAETFDDGTYDNCCLDGFEVARMVDGPCDQDSTEDDFAPTVEFCCADLGDTITVVFRAYDCTGNTNDCMVQVYVDDKLKPVCSAPANVTVSCENFDPSLWAYGAATATDNCCMDTITTVVILTNFDTTCNRGTITRRFTAVDCAGQTSTCTQRIVVSYDQDYYVRFPNDQIVYECSGDGLYTVPTFFGEDCELLATSFHDEVFVIDPDACFKIERTWEVINWCTHNPNLPLTYVPNPNPNVNFNSPQNLPGPIVSAPGTTGTWAPTVVRINPTDPQPTNFSIYWDANTNGYQYKQIIKVIDTEAPVVSNCPDTLVEVCDLTPNSNQFWNDMAWWDATHQLHDLCEAPTDLNISTTDSCTGASVNVRYLLFLDTDNDGDMETVISSTNPPTSAGTVNVGNAANPNFTGGVTTSFDQRLVPSNQKYRFTVQTTLAGNSKVAALRWNTDQSPNTYVVPQLPYGTHKIKWIVQDGCGNEKVCEYEFVVKDCKAPTVVCINGLSTNIMPTDMIVLWASDFLQYTEDNCTPEDQIKIGIRRKGAGTGFPTNPDGSPQTSVTFTCADLGTQFVELWAEDKAGNADYCETYVIVQDNAGNCSNSNVTVAGELKTEMQEGLEDGDIELNGSHPALPPVNMFEISDAVGFYMFPNALPLAANYTVTPLKDVEYLNGVSTYDLVLINKHILGIESFDSPYKIIAADANNSKSVTTFDIAEIRKLILGIYLDLPNNTSWRFVNGEYTFPNPDNPFVPAFPESKSVADVQANQIAEDFVAMKIGDVNNSAMANNFMSVDDRTSSTLLFDVTDRSVARGEAFEVHFKADQFAQGYQFTLNLKGLEVLDIVPGEGMSSANFAVFSEVLTTSFDAAPGLNAPAEFTLRLRAKTAGNLRNMMNISSSVTKAEAYGKDAERQSVALRFNGKEVRGVGFEVYQNQPNPWISRTVIGFHLPEADDVTLTVFDESGRQLYRQVGDFGKGYNAFTLDKELVNTTGLLYYQVSTSEHSATMKMIQTK